MRGASISGSRDLELFLLPLSGSFLYLLPPSSFLLPPSSFRLQALPLPRHAADPEAALGRGSGREIDGDERGNRNVFADLADVIDLQGRAPVLLGLAAD